MMPDRGDLSCLQDSVAQELLTSRIPARLAYSWSDGTPRVVPIWFHWTGSEIVVTSFLRSPKSHVLKTGDAVAITIDSDNYPYHVLSVRGTTTVDAVNGVPDEYAAAARRYFGDEQGQGWIDSLPADAPMVRFAITPTWANIIDFESRFPVAMSS